MDDAHALPDDLAACQRLLLAAFQKTTELSRVLDETAASYEELQATHQAALDELNALKRWIYGRRTEKLVEGEGQRHLFDLESPITSAPPFEPTPESQRLPTARRHRREFDLDKLPHFRHEHDLSEADQQCSGCGRTKDRIGQDESRILEYVPAKLEVHVHVRPKYACRYCKDGVASPPPPERPIARGIAGPGLIAQIVVAKFGDHGVQGEAVSKMREGLSWPGDRTWPQTSPNCGGQEPSWETSGANGAARPRQVRSAKSNAREPLMKCRNRTDDVKTGERWLPRDQYGRCLYLAHMASGIKAARSRIRLGYGTLEPVVSMTREKPKRTTRKGESTDARHRGGTTRSSAEGRVMRLERRGRVIQSLDNRSTASAGGTHD